MKHLLVPVDFSEVTPTVSDVAANLARFMQGQITFLHVKHLKSSPDVDQQLQQLAAVVSEKSGITCGSRIREGSIFTEVRAEASSGKYDFAVVGSHGFKGIREVMFGADILKLIKLIPIPAITVLKGYVLPNDGFRKIVVPVASHKTFHLIIEAVIEIAKIFDSEIHLYAVRKPDIEWSNQLISNIANAKTAFKNAEINCVFVSEQQTSYSLGYSKQTLSYATASNTNLIAMMAVPAKEHFYFADSDKEQIITNKSLIPVISTSDRL